MLGALIWQTAQSAPMKPGVLAAMVALSVMIEGAYQLTKRGRRPRRQELQGKDHE